MKPFWLNLVTLSVTVALLAALSLPAKEALEAARGTAATVPTGDAPWPRPAPDPRRAFGVYVDPWHVDDWARSVDEAPQLVAKFEAFSNQRTLDPWLGQLQRIGIRRALVSWEPWKAVPAARGHGGAGATAAGLRQPRRRPRLATSCALPAASPGSAASSIGASH